VRLVHHNYTLASEPNLDQRFRGAPHCGSS
jgi:hypothetical protein